MTELQKVTGAWEHICCWCLRDMLNRRLRSGRSNWRTPLSSVHGHAWSVYVAAHVAQRYEIRDNVKSPRSSMTIWIPSRLPSIWIDTSKFVFEKRFLFFFRDRLSWLIHIFWPASVKLCEESLTRASFITNLRAGETKSLKVGLLLHERQKQSVRPQHICQRCVTTSLTEVASYTILPCFFWQRDFCGGYWGSTFPSPINKHILFWLLTWLKRSSLSTPSPGRYNGHWWDPWVKTQKGNRLKCGYLT